MVFLRPSEAMSSCSYQVAKKHAYEKAPMAPFGRRKLVRCEVVCKKRPRWSAGSLKVHPAQVPPSPIPTPELAPPSPDPIPTPEMAPPSPPVRQTPLQIYNGHWEDGQWIVTEPCVARLKWFYCNGNKAYLEQIIWWADIFEPMRLTTR